MIVGEYLEAEADLLEVTDATDAFCLSAGLRHGGREQRNQNSKHRDNDHQFYARKCWAAGGGQRYGMKLQDIRFVGCLSEGMSPGRAMDLTGSFIGGQQIGKSHRRNMMGSL